MTERSLFWDGAVLGDCGPYVSAQFHDQMLRSVTGCTGDRGVLLGWLDSLLVTGASSPVSIATGAAVVYGTFFESDAAETVSIDTPLAGLSRYDVIVVRRDVSLQTVRIGKVVGTASGGTPTVPSLTQDVAGIYEIPLANVLIADTGVITITDARDYAVYSTAWPANTVTAGMYVEDSVTADKMADQTRWDLKGAGSIVPDATNPCTRAAAAGYDYWSFATGVLNEGWVYFMLPGSYVSTTAAFYLWTCPDVAAAGNVKWDYNVYYGWEGGPLTNATGSILVAQGGRAITETWSDAYFTLTSPLLGTSHVIALQVQRDGGHGTDTYGSAARLHGIELRWTAHA